MEKNRMRQVLIVIVVFILCENRIIAQAIDLGTWNIVNVKYNYNKEWSVFVEGQLRSLKFYSNFHYYEYKGGISYSGLKNVKVTLGSGSYQTYKEGGNFVLPKNNDEFRIWPQISLLQSLGKFNIEQRYRAEFRFTSDGYRNRFRYRLGVSYPLGKQKNGFNPFQISASDEIFFTNKEPYFERNRMLFAFNYKPSTSSTIQIGYIHQFDYKINDESGRDFFQIGYFLELSRKSTSNSAIENYSKDN